MLHSLPKFGRRYACRSRICSSHGTCSRHVLTAAWLTAARLVLMASRLHGSRPLMARTHGRTAATAHGCTTRGPRLHVAHGCTRPTAHGSRLWRAHGRTAHACTDHGRTARAARLVLHAARLTLHPARSLVWDGALAEWVQVMGYTHRTLLLRPVHADRDGCTAQKICPPRPHRGVDGAPRRDVTCPPHPYPAPPGRGHGSSDACMMHVRMHALQAGACACVRRAWARHHAAPAVHSAGPLARGAKRCEGAGPLA